VRPTLSWFEGHTDEQQSTQVTATAEVDQTLDELTSRAQAAGLPFNVDLDRHDGTHMSIVVGAEETFVEWVQLEPWSSRAATSDRRPEEDDLVSFAGNGQYSEIRVTSGSTSNSAAKRSVTISRAELSWRRSTGSKPKRPSLTTAGLLATPASVEGVLIPKVGTPSQWRSINARSRVRNGTPYGRGAMVDLALSGRSCGALLVSGPLGKVLGGPQLLSPTGGITDEISAERDRRERKLDIRPLARNQKLARRRQRP
jgi:hypothetical protein